MKSLRTLGIVALITGAILFFLNYTMVDNGVFYFRKLFKFSIFAICIGITFILFIGKPLTDEQKKDKKNDFKYAWDNAPFLHKIGWVVGTLGGFVLSQYYELFLPR